MNRVSYKLVGDDLARSAVVFSPHPDDETLGCGGTIIKKRRTGADVKIVFMTDGRRSHSQFIPRDELKSIRASEALAAGRMLGVEESDIIFLEFKDGRLKKSQGSAIHKVVEILRREQPDDIFIPYYKEALPDHSATNRIVVSALQMYSSQVTIYEYPIWFWFHWPWVSVPIRSDQDILERLQVNFGSAFRLLRDFRYSVYVGDILECKQVALDQHKSQMTRLIPNSQWPTLDDVSNGEFLACFFQEHEFFRRYTISGEC